mmetsp:Transcript_77697/g.219701  ORF Transcript_77697/g.219701 Transcript_77697/m.219701 type:complete len:229 (+) Transcript_77697:164-850(+)
MSCAFATHCMMAAIDAAPVSDWHERASRSVREKVRGWTASNDGSGESSESSEPGEAGMAWPSSPVAPAQESAASLCAVYLLMPPLLLLVPPLVVLLPEMLCFPATGGELPDRVSGLACPAGPGLQPCAPHPRGVAGFAIAAGTLPGGFSAVHAVPLSSARHGAGETARPGCATGTRIESSPSSSSLPHSLVSSTSSAKGSYISAIAPGGKSAPSSSMREGRLRPPWSR